MIFGDQGSVGQPVSGVNRLLLARVSRPAFPELCIKLRDSIDRWGSIEPSPTLLNLTPFSLGNRGSVGASNPFTEMVPGELFDHTLAARVSHRPDKFRVLIQLEYCAAKGIDVVWWDQQAVETVQHHVTRFSGGDLGKARSGSFVGYFGAPFEFRGENENAAFPVQFFDFFVESEQLYRCR